MLVDFFYFINYLNYSLIVFFLENRNRVYKISIGSVKGEFWSRF